MTHTDQSTRLKRLAPPYLEVWEQDSRNPELYHYEGETLTNAALHRRVDRSPGLTVVRLDRSVMPYKAGNIAPRRG